MKLVHFGCFGDPAPQLDIEGLNNIIAALQIS